MGANRNRKMQNGLRNAVLLRIITIKPNIGYSVELGVQRSKVKEAVPLAVASVLSKLDDVIGVDKSAAAAVAGGAEAAVEAPCEANTMPGCFCNK